MSCAQELVDRNTNHLGTALMFGSNSDQARSLELVVLPGAISPPDTRPIRRFHPSWLYCRVHNASDKPLFVYGPRHLSEHTTIPTSLFILPAGSSTPRRWDCKGILIPSDHTVAQESSIIQGPVALKYRDMRRITVTESGGLYQCPPSNGLREPGQLDFAIPLASYEALFDLPRRRVAV